MKKLSVYVSISMIIWLLPTKIYSQEVIIIKKVNNAYRLSCKVNGLPMDFIFDTGATDVSISSTIADSLIKKGLLTQNDIKGKMKYSIANGKIEEGTQIILKEIILNGVILQNVEARIVNHADAPLLFGLTAINKLGKVVIEDNRILIYPETNRFFAQNNKEKDGRIRLDKQRVNLSTLAKFYYDRGFERYKRGWDGIKYLEVIGAIEDLSKAISIDKNNPGLFNIRAIVEKNFKKYKEALADYTKAIELDPTNDYSYIERGDQKRLMGDELGAIEDYTKAIEINQDTWLNAWTSRASAKEELGDYQGAIDDFTILIDKRGPDPEYYHNRAIVKKHMHDYFGAIQDETKAIDLETNLSNPDFVDALFNRGFANDMIENYNAAIEDYSKAIEFQKDNFDYYVMRAQAKSNINDSKGALEDYTKSINLHPNISGTFLLRGYEKIRIGDKKGACLDLIKAVKLGSKDAEELKLTQELINIHCR